MYKDTLLGQMASSEQAEVWSPWSCWIEQLECVLSSPGGKNSTSQWWKNQTVQQRDGFFNYEAEIYHNLKVYLSLKD